MSEDPSTGKPAKCLVVNADDFGMSPGVNHGIIRAHEQGIVTSASLMVRWPAAEEAARYAAEHPRLGLGLHVDFGEWIYRDGEWEPLYEVVPPGDAGAAAAEFARQLDAFRRLTGRDPAHLDSHQHVHREGPLRSLMAEAAARMRIPLRHFPTPGVVPVRYCGDFFAQDRHGESWLEFIGVEALLAVLKSLEPGVTELCCHPGWELAGDGLRTGYLSEREEEVRTLCEPRVRRAVEESNVVLRSFADLA